MKMHIREEVIKALHESVVRLNAAMGIMNYAAKALTSASLEIDGLRQQVTDLEQRAENLEIEVIESHEYDD